MKVILRMISSTLGTNFTENEIIEETLEAQEFDPLNDPIGKSIFKV